MTLHRTEVPPLAPELLGMVECRSWERRRRAKDFEFVGRLVDQKHTVLATTLQNMAVTIVGRVLLHKLPDGTLCPHPKADSGAVSRLGEVLMQLTKHAPVTQPLSQSAFCALQNTARKTKRMQLAMASLQAKALTRRDAEIKAFGKKEKLKFGKPLRIIQPRDDRYHLELGRRLKPMEKGLYKSINESLGYTVVMKGLNGVQRATAVLEGFNSTVDPVAVSVDIAQFDASVGIAVQKQEHRPYARCAPGDSMLAKLLKWQLTNKGRAMCDDGLVKYKREGGRMSGDANTSLGNILICCAAHVAYARELGIPFRLFNDGDDSVIIISRKHLKKFERGVQGFWARLGFRVTVDNITDQFSEIDFCQSRPVCVGGTWAFVRNPVNAIQKDLVNPVCPADDRERRAWYAAVGAGGLSEYGAVPIYGAFYGMLARAGKANDTQYQWRAAQAKSLKFQKTGLTGNVVESHTRHYFWRSFGITPDEQRAFEQRLHDFEITSIPCQHVTPAVCPLTELLQPQSSFLSP